jgi:transposase
VDRQTLRDWVHRYNAEGLEGLFNQPRRNGPRWRCVDLQKRIREEFSVELHESTVGKLLHKL